VDERTPLFVTLTKVLGPALSGEAGSEAFAGMTIREVEQGTSSFVTPGEAGVQLDDCVMRGRRPAHLPPLVTLTKVRVQLRRPRAGFRLSPE